MKYNFIPDLEFPVYVVSRNQIRDIFLGRPFLKSNDNVFLKKYSVCGWKNNLDSDYRVILYQLISHNFDIVSGSKRKLQKDTERALKIIFLYAYNLFGYSANEFLEKEQLFRAVFFSAGLNYVLSEEVQKLFLKMLECQRMIGIEADRIVLNHENIHIEDAFFLKKDKQNFTGVHIFGWKALSSFVKDRIEKKGIMDIIYDYIFNAKTREEEWENWHIRIQQQINNFKKKGIMPVELSDPDEKRYYKILYDTVIPFFPKGRKNKFIEIGSGSGTLSALLQKTFPMTEAYLLDDAKTALEYSKIINKNAIRILEDARKTSFRSNSFDFVYSIGLVEHFTDNSIEEILIESVRILKKDGVMFLAVPNFLSPDIISIWHKYGKGSERYISKKQLRRYMYNLDLEVVKVGNLKYVNNFFTKHEMPNVESFLGQAGFGFLNYIIVRKK